MVDISLNKRNNQSSPLSQTQVDENWSILEVAVNSKGEGSGTLTGVIITDNSNIVNATVSNGASSSTITISDVGSLTANRVLASPNGSSGSPSYRALVNDDLPLVAVNKGGTNSTTALTNNKVMVSSGGAIVESSTIDTTELSYLNGINALSNGILRKGTGVLSTGSIDLTADVTEILEPANGGTGLDLSGSFANGKILISTASGFFLNTLTAGSNIVITNGSGTVSIAVDSTGLVPSTRTVNAKPLSSNIVLTTDDVSDAASSNKYFTNAAVNTQIDAYVTAAAPLVKTGGALTIVAANTTTNGYLTSTDWNTFSNKIGGNFTQNTTAGYQIPNFNYDIWYTSAEIILPSIASTDIGKIMFIKNTNTAANSKVNPYTGATIDGAANVTLSHSAGGLNQGGIMIQATTTSTWSILSHTGSIT